MIKLLGINGSPRKDGNTQFLLNEVLKSGVQLGAEAELIHLVELELKPCTDCKSCYKTKFCVIKDDLGKIFEKMKESDGIIIGSPSYNWNVTAQTKMFIDRMGLLIPVRGRVDFANKVGGAIAVGGRSGMMHCLSQIILFQMSGRMIPIPPFILSISYDKGESAKDPRAINESKELGKRMVQVAEATASLRKIPPEIIKTPRYGW